MHYIKIYMKIHVKIAPTCFGLTTILREHIVDFSCYNYSNNRLKYVVLDCSELWLHIMSSAW
jgi:hypothetical protein